MRRRPAGADSTSTWLLKLSRSHKTRHHALEASATRCRADSTPSTGRVKQGRWASAGRIEGSRRTDTTRHLRRRRRSSLLLGRAPRSRAMLSGVSTDVAYMLRLKEPNAKDILMKMAC